MRQHRQVSNAPIVVVEGPDDLLTLRTHLDGFDIFPGDGKTNVISCCRALLNWQIERFICVVDRDFNWRDHEDTDRACYPYLLRDLESMLISLGVLALILDHQGSAEKLSATGGPHKLVRRLVELVEPVSRLRAANAREGWGIRFDEVSLGSKIDAKNLTLKVPNYCVALAATTSGVDAATLIDASTASVDDEFGPRGKDVLVATGVALRRCAGSLQHQATTEPIISAQLRSSCGLALSQSDWLHELRSRATEVRAQSSSGSRP